MILTEDCKLAHKIQQRHDHHYDASQRKSFIIRYFGYSKFCASNKKTSIPVNDPMYTKCNYNYSCGDVYVINMQDMYALSVVQDAVNDLPVYYQNPDIYFPVPIVGFIILCIALEGLMDPRMYMNSMARAVAVVMTVLSGIMIIVGPILFSISSNKCTKVMKRCAMDICEHYYALDKLVKEENEYESVINQRRYYSACPNCGAVRMGNYDHCKMCGSQLWMENDEQWTNYH